jgi:hypothetical protein
MIHLCVFLLQGKKLFFLLHSWQYFGQRFNAAENEKFFPQPRHVLEIISDARFFARHSWQ